jgi:hypothetical protein
MESDSHNTAVGYQVESNGLRLCRGQTHPSILHLVAGWVGFFLFEMLFTWSIFVVEKVHFPPKKCLRMSTICGHCDIVVSLFLLGLIDWKGVFLRWEN